MSVNKMICLKNIVVNISDSYQSGNAAFVSKLMANCSTFRSISQESVKCAATLKLSWREGVPTPTLCNTLPTFTFMF